MQMLTAGIQLKSTEVERPKGQEQNTDSNYLMSYSNESLIEWLQSPDLHLNRDERSLAKEQVEGN